MRPWVWLALPVTVGVYLAFVRLHARRASTFTLPVLGTLVVVTSLLALTGSDLDAYGITTWPLQWMLGPATVALAVPLYRQRATLRAHLARVLVSVSIGSLVGAASAIGLARLLGLSRTWIASLAPKSVTTPVAMPLSERLGGEPSLAAAAVLVTGILGLVFGAPLLDLVRVRSALARGLAYGVGAHGVGTMRALQEGEEAGAAGGVAMVLAAIFTSIVVGALVRLLG